MYVNTYFQYIYMTRKNTMKSSSIQVMLFSEYSSDIANFINLTMKTQGQCHGVIQPKFQCRINVPKMIRRTILNIRWLYVFNLEIAAQDDKL